MSKIVRVSLFRQSLRSYFWLQAQNQINDAICSRFCRFVVMLFVLCSVCSINVVRREITTNWILHYPNLSDGPEMKFHSRLLVVSLSSSTFSLSLWISSTIPLSVLVLISSSWRCQLWPDVTFQLRSRQISTMVERERAARKTRSKFLELPGARAPAHGEGPSRNQFRCWCKWRQKRTVKRENLSSHIRARQPLKVGVRMTRFCA